MTATETILTGTVNNAKTWANRFKARFLEAGIVSYENVGCGKALLGHETIAKYANTFIGRPVTIEHQRVTPDTMEPVAQGYISEVWHDPKDGWWWCSGTIHKDEAKELVRKGFSVSCSYKVNATTHGGEYHAIPYDEEITAFEGMHLAIVDNPRYERAVILFNSKTNKMFKFIKKLVSGGEQKDNSASSPEELSGESIIQTPEGKELTLSALVENSKEIDEVDIGEGKRVKLNELVAGYLANEASKAKKNEKEEPKEEKAEEPKEKENKSEEAKEKKEEESKDNALKAGAHFQELLNARNTAFESNNISKSADTFEDKLARGKALFGALNKS